MIARCPCLTMDGGAREFGLFTPSKQYTKLYIYEAGGARKNKTIEPIQSNINLEVQCLREKENV